MVLFKKNGVSIDLSASANLNNRLKLGISLMDLGKMQYQSAENSVQTHVSGEELNLESFYSISSFEEFADTLRATIEYTVPVDEEYTAHLPRTFNVYADYKFSDQLGLGFVVSNLNSKLVDDSQNKLSLWSYTLVANYAIGKFSTMLPFKYNQINDFEAGLGVCDVVPA